MKVDVLMPQEGMAMQSGVVTAWHKQVGDRVEKGEPIVEVEAEKVTFDVVATHSGVLASVLVEVGAEVPVRTVLATLDTLK